jgi:hypothetical protein
MINSERYTTYKDFFPHYLREHSKKRTRLLHYMGTGFSNFLLIIVIVTQNYYLIPLMLLAGYGPAWMAHFFIEHNKPATFQYPLWSLIGDHHMTLLMLTGKLKDKMSKAGVNI